MNNLDKRIGDALTTPITSADLRGAYRRSYGGSRDAANAAKKIRKEALDPIAWPDPNKARAAVENATSQSID